MNATGSRASLAVWAALGSRGPGGRLMALPGFYAGWAAPFSVSPHGDVAPRHGPVVPRRRADARRPAPGGVAGVVAGAVIDQGGRVHRPGLAVHSHGPAGPHGRALTRPRVAAAVGRDDLDLLRPGVV